jgi:hypothetical protein
MDKCHICQVLLARLGEMYGWREIYKRNPKHDDYGVFCTEVCWKPGNLSEKDRLYFYFTDPSFERDPVWNTHNFFRMDLWPADSFAQKFRPPIIIDSDEMAQLLRQQQTNTGSPTSRALAIAWLTRCRANEAGQHQRCNKDTYYLPTRLLDVKYSQATSKLRLVSPALTPELFIDDRMWITLSHCWGEWGAQENPILTVANLEERHATGVKVADLPKTFQQAMEIASWFNSK